VERDTSQRRAIRQVFEQIERPLSPQEVLDHAQGSVPKMGIATVYRTLKSLTEQGWLAAVELPGQPQRYEVAGKKHHHHFNCRKCGRVFELEGCPGNLARMVPEGFEMEDHEVFIFGRCRDCR
jgi:Fur family ferric uptake transcriptional regulator